MLAQSASPTTVGNLATLLSPTLPSWPEKKFARSTLRPGPHLDSPTLLSPRDLVS